MVTKKEAREMKELDKIWNDIDEGKCITMSKKKFFREMKNW